MLNEYPWRAGTGNNNSADIIFAVLADDICPHYPGDLRDIDNTDRYGDTGHRLPEDRNEHCCKRNTGDRHKDIDDPHDQLRYPRPCYSCCRTDKRTDYQREKHGRQANDQRVPCAVHHSGKHIPAKVIRTKPVFGTRRQQFYGDLQRVARGNNGSEDSACSQESKENKRYTRANRHP